MKKIIVIVMLFLVLATESYGAISDDVYVRRDVFEVYMQSMNAKLDMTLEQIKELRGEFKELRGEFKELREEQKTMRGELVELARVVSVMSERIDRNFETLSGRIDGLDKRMDNQQNYLYLVLVILGIIVALPTVQKMLQGWQDRKESRRAYITLDDVRRLIEENNAKLSGRPQA